MPGSSRYTNAVNWSTRDRSNFLDKPVKDNLDLVAEEDRNNIDAYSAEGILTVAAI